MDYYNEKRKACLLIDELNRDGKSIEEITFHIQTKFGFGKKLVVDRIELTKQISRGI